MIEGYAKIDAAANIADIYAYGGDVENAFLYLHNALEEKSPTLTEAIFYPAFKVLYKDPRWNQLINDMGLPEGHGVPGEKYKPSNPCLAGRPEGGIKM